jgi:AGZA family xanthine/uracil permease-like MFS transporter
MAKTESDQTVRVPEPSGGGLDAFFKIGARGSNVRTEVVAGLTTFLTMAYILFVNPGILGSVPDSAGTTLAFPQLLTVTALVGGIATIAMGLYSNYPFAIASGLGLNAFVAFTLVAGRGLTWPEAMGVIVVEGLVITALVLTNLRQMIMDAIPMDLKRAIGIGIGLFLMIIGLENAGIVVNSDATLVTLSTDLTTLRMLVFAIGLALAILFTVRKTKGGLLLSIVAATVVGVFLNEVFAHSLMWVATPGVGVVPDAVTATPDFGLVGQFSFGFFSSLGVITAIGMVIAVMLSDFFDTMGTATSLADEAGLLAEDGSLPNAKKVLLVDSLAAAAGGAASASSNTTFIESASGIGEGGRTGLASVVTGLLFLACLFISPIAGVIPPEATAPVLIVVGYLMMQAAGDISWRDPAMGIPCLLTIGLMPFTYSITNGVGAGFVTYVFIRLVQGKARDVHPLLYVVAAIFVVYFLKGVLA